MGPMVNATARAAMTLFFAFVSAQSRRAFRPSRRFHAAFVPMKKSKEGRSIPSSSVQSHARFSRSQMLPRKTVNLPGLCLQERQRLALYFSTAPPFEVSSKIIDLVEEDDEQKIYQELKWLSQEIRKHDALYYNTNNDAEEDIQNLQIITDDDYDALVRREEEICTKYPDLQVKWEVESGLGVQATRVGGRVGISDATAPTPRFQKRTHLTPMLSLDNVTTKEQLYAWLERLRKKVLLEWNQHDSESPPSITIVTEPKLDGLSLSLRYQLDSDNDLYNLVWACTRGDGKKGQDVTQPVVDGMKLPDKLTLPTTGYAPDALEIRGEVVFPKSIFEDLKHQAKQEAKDTVPLQRFSNARNAASGILLRKQEDGRQENSTSSVLDTLSLQSMLQFYAYDVVTVKHINRKTESSLDWIEDTLKSRQQLQSWGFHVPFPMASTPLEWAKQDVLANSNETENEDIGFRPWTDEELQPMLDYHAALGRHRELMHEHESKSGRTPSIKPTSNAESSRNLDWGDYDMDGCVHKISQSALRRLVGHSNRAPRWAVAHKYPAQSAITSLMGIEIQVGRKTGALTPVAVLEPVELAGGVTVTKATLHNFQHMQQLLWGALPNETSIDSQENPPMYLALGSKVLVHRAGDVIPQVVQLAEAPQRAIENDTSNATDSHWIDLSAPSCCPACGSPAVVDVRPARKSKEESEDKNAPVDTRSKGQILRCSGPQLLCPPRAIGALVHAFSRDALDVSGISEARIQQLATFNSTSEESSGSNETSDSNSHSASPISLRFPSDIFRIAKDPVALEAIANLPGWGPKSAQNLANAANQVASNGVSLARFIYSLAIRFAGVHSSKILATAYGSVEAFLDAVDEASQMSSINAESSGETSTKECVDQPFAVLVDKDRDVNRGIGPSLLSSLVEFSKESELVAAARDLASLVEVLDDEDFAAGGTGRTLNQNFEEDLITKPLLGMKVVFTGSLTSLNLTRKDAQLLVKSMGAKATPGTISRATDIVVVGEKGGGKKLDSAKDLGIRVMELDEFAALLNRFKQ